VENTHDEGSCHFQPDYDSIIYQDNSPMKCQTREARNGRAAAEAVGDQYPTHQTSESSDIMIDLLDHFDTMEF
jgi:hypothetical protein